MKYLRTVLTWIAILFWATMFAGGLASMALTRLYADICHFDYGWSCKGGSAWLDILSRLADVPITAMFVGWFVLPSPIWLDGPWWMAIGLAACAWGILAGTAWLLESLLRQLDKIWLRQRS